MTTKAVAISGTVGKQVYATTVPVRLKGLSLSPLSAAAYVKIRDGNASGDVILEQSCPANSSQPLNFDEPILFSKGMHVKVLGTGAVCYLFVE
jgi:hypothetical protein